MITVIHGPMASGKTKYKQAFAAHFGCTHVVDNWDAQRHEFPQDDCRLVLTTSHPSDIRKAFQLDRPQAEVRLVTIQNARLAIGATALSPMMVERLSR